LKRIDAYYKTVVEQFPGSYGQRFFWAMQVSIMEIGDHSYNFTFREKIRQKEIKPETLSDGIIGLFIPSSFNAL